MSSDSRQTRMVSSSTTPQSFVDVSRVTLYELKNIVKNQMSTPLIKRLLAWGDPSQNYLILRYIAISLLKKNGFDSTEENIELVST